MECDTYLIDEAQRGWHWPSFTQPIENDMSERELLGLPRRFTLQRFAKSMPACYAELRNYGIDALLDLINDRAVTVERRIVAGNILGALGDPRILPEHPAMIDVKGALVQIGLCPEQVSEVHVRYRQLGLKEDWIAKEAPAHLINLSDYRIARYPVTNVEYRQFLLESGHAELPLNWEFGIYPISKANHPVYTVSPAAADAYAAWLAAKTGRRFRLPTEAEWEYAAAGPKGFEFPWGDEFICDMANTAEFGLMCTTPVGVLPEGNSPFGLADMAGNVEEYVATDYQPYAHGRFVKDHLADMERSYRVARGGSFARFRDLARTRRRHGWNALSRVYVMGFRLAESP